LPHWIRVEERLYAVSIAFNFFFSLLVALVLGASLPANADQCIPYCHGGVIPPMANANGEIYAAQSGEVEGYFYGFQAHDMSVVRMWDVTTNTLSPWVFPNLTTKVGTVADFGAVNKGDLLVFELWDKIQDTAQPGAGNIYYTDPRLNPDGRPHFYLANWGGGMVGNVFVPAGMFMGGEDLPYPYSDWDYNDNEFVWNIRASSAGGSVPTPEPASLAMLLTGAITSASVLRRARS
jgi:hypothetical protein